MECYWKVVARAGVRGGVVVGMCERGEKVEVSMVVWVISATQLGHGVVVEGRVMMLLWFWNGHEFIEIGEGRGRDGGM